jgi:hypothetical protein
VVEVVVEEGPDTYFRIMVQVEEGVVGLDRASSSPPRVFLQQRLLQLVLVVRQALDVQAAAVMVMLGELGGIHLSFH